MPFFLAAAAISFGVWYWLMYFAEMDRGIPTTPEQRVYACIFLWLILLVGVLLWPRRRRPVPLMDYLIPCSAFYVGTIGLSLLAYHYRQVVLFVRKEELPVPWGTRAGQACSAIGGLAALVYLILYRAFPPPLDAANAHTGWRRHIQYTLLDDMVGFFQGPQG